MGGQKKLILYSTNKLKTSNIILITKKVLDIAIKEVENHKIITICELKFVSLLLKSNATKDRRELVKKRVVETNNLSINFLSVLSSSKTLINFEFEKAGIKENTAKNNAVANAENDNEADIISR